MIKNTLLYYRTKNQYNANLSQINTSLAIAFVEDEGAIYTHDHKFGGSSTVKVVFKPAVVYFQADEDGYIDSPVSNEVEVDIYKDGTKTTMRSVEVISYPAGTTALWNTVTGKLDVIASADDPADYEGTIVVKAWSTDGFSAIGEVSVVGLRSGAQGIAGDKGDKGDTGEQGIQGILGPKGDKGDDGTSVKIMPSANDCVNIGDGYIDQNGHLLVLSSIDPKIFTDAGEIKGPKGDKGDTGDTTGYDVVMLPSQIRVMGDDAGFCDSPVVKKLDVKVYKDNVETGLRSVINVSAPDGVSVTDWVEDESAVKKITITADDPAEWEGDIVFDVVCTDGKVIKKTLPVVAVRQSLDLTKEHDEITVEQQAMARQNIGIDDEAIGAGEDSKKVFLKMNMVDGKNVLTQDMFYKDSNVAGSSGIDDGESANGRVPNTNKIFVVQHDYDLDGETIELPEGTTLEFGGGSISNGSLKGDCSILNAPADLYESVDCSALYIINDRHLCKGDLLSLNETTANDCYISEKDTLDQQFISSHYYCIDNLDSLICICNNSHITTGFSIDYYFYDESFFYIGRSIWTAKANAYRYDDIPEDAVYVVFKISTSGQAAPKIFPYLKYISFNFLNNTAVYIDDDHKKENDVLSITVSNPTRGRIYTKDGVNLYSTWADTPVVIDGVSYSRSSLYIPQNVLRKYDVLEFVGHGPGVEGYATGVVHFLKKCPTVEAEPVEYSDWYGRSVSCYQSQTTNLLIPPDCRCVYVSYCWFSNGVPVKAFPKALNLKKKNIYGEGILSSLDIYKNRNVNIKELKFFVWNVGADNLGGHLHSDVMDATLAEKRRNGFYNVIDRYNDTHEFLINEYLRWNADSAYNTLDYLNRIKRYGLINYGNFKYSNNALFYKNGLLCHGINWLDSLKGKYATNGPMYSNSYNIYRYCVGNTIITVVHIHFPAGIASDFTNTTLGIYREIKSKISSYLNVIITGDFNNADSSLIEQVFTSSEGWHIANTEQDNTPTCDFSSSGRVDRILDYCVWRAADIEIRNFRVITDAIIPDSEELAETEYYDSSIASDDQRYIDHINHRLSDHWPIEFTVVPKNNSNMTPSTKGNTRYNDVNGRFEWHDGNNWIGCAKDSDLPSTGTTSQRPENARTGYIYYNTDTNSIEVYDGTEWMPTGGTTTLNQTEPKLKILGVGDSVIRGWRNDERAFFDYLTDEYSKTAISGARITIKSGYNVKDFVQQVIDEPGYDADAIIVGTGVNDWALDAPLGNLPSVVITDDTAANALDRTKVYDAVQALFYQMVKKYPKAQKFFVSHFKFDCDVSTDIHGKYTDNNEEGYSYAEMMEGVEQICKLYGVIYIDVLNKSFVNSEFAVYNAPTKYSEVADADKWSWNRTYYVDADGLHPTDLCYKEVFAKLIKPELNIGVAKHLVFSTKDEETFLDSNNNQIIVTE